MVSPPLFIVNYKKVDNRGIAVTNKEAVLHALAHGRDGYISGAELARALSISRAAVWKGVERLRDEGHLIEGKPKIGYRLISMTPLFDRERLQRALAGWDVQLFDTIDSTNRYAKSLESEKAVVIALAQSAGRGRRGRSFYSPRGGLYLSLRFPLSFALEEAMLLTSMASVAVHRSLWEVAGVDCSIKWVNDLYLGGKKLCGILTEGVVGLESGQLSSVVVGIGINLFTALGEELERTAVSLYESEDAAFSSLDANDLVIKIVSHMSALISALPDRSYLEYYRAHSLLDGRDVVVHQAGGQFEAHVIGIDDDAHLVVEDREGTVHTLSSAEITIRLAR
mgnify:CR=1 FL=1